ncbi:MAG: hypothetical protein A2Y15_02785 [Clostridiales bacterium GWF2_36_10]|nr:MAG: hypothetical protein A2Y15_02785 [Clostridiales bacterium GWF2_36_10]HAN21123.1 hypothetical protein [Clostridiales bacterium]
MDEKLRITERIRKDENDYERALCKAAESVCSDNNIRLVLITGGSCSGKTTTTKKLAALITEMGRHTHTISLDDFYRNAEDSIYLENGTRDIESINSLEIGLIKKCFCDLVEGKEASVPRFDFISQHRTDNYEQIILDGTEVAIIEGLHALNPQLYDGFSSSSKTYKVYLFSDDGEDGDPRFKRRLVRDHYYRGSDAKATFDQWDIVKSNELEFINKFADTADIKINTFFPYEKGVLAGPAIEVLSKLPSESKYIERAIEFIKKLSVIKQIPASYVPKNSLLQEFIKVD